MSDSGKEGSMTLAVYCVIAIIVLALVVLFIIGPRLRAKMASASEPAPTPLTLERLRQLDSETVGDHSYIKLPAHFSRSYPDRDDLGNAVMEVVDGFERKHSELRVTDWKVDAGNGDIYGIWLDHLPCTPQ